MLKLNSGKARRVLGWDPVWTWEEAIDRTALWFRAYYERGVLLSHEDLDQFLLAAARRPCPWVNG